METVARDSVRAAALNRDERVLLLRAVLPDEDWWELPGGGIDAGETPAEAALRELREETGIGLDRFDADLGIVDTEFVWNGRRYLQRERVFLARSVDAEAALRESVTPPAAAHVEYRWWSIAELKGTAAPIHPPQLVELLLRV